MKKHLFIALCLTGAILGTMSSCGGDEMSGPEEGAEIYAAISGDGHTLTLYFDAQRENRGGVTDWSIYNNVESTTNDVTKIVFDRSMVFATPSSTSCWFDCFKHVETIEHLDYLNTSKVTNMNRMFNSCYKLSSIDVSHFNTSKVGNMNYMFYQCESITSLDLRSFSFSNLTDAYCMFNLCQTLQTIYCDEDMNQCSLNYPDNLFKFCTALVGGKGTTYDQEHVDVTYARPDGAGGEKGYFTGHALETYAAYNAGNRVLTIYYDREADTHTEVYPIDGLPTSVLSSVKTVEIDPSIANYKITSTASWFANMSSLETVKGLDNLNTTYLTDVSMMFAKCTSLKTINLNGFYFSKAIHCDGMFMGCSALTTITCMYNYSCQSNLSSVGMFSGCTSLRGGNGTGYNTSHLDASYACPDKEDSPGYFTSVEIFAMLTDDGQTITFYYDKQPETLDGNACSWREKDGARFMNTTVSKKITKAIFDASVKNARPVTIEKMFLQFQQLKTIEHLDYLNTSNVKSMQGMFSNCLNLTEVDIRSFDMHKVTDIAAMFYNSGLKTIYCNEDWRTYTNITESSHIFGRSANLVGDNGTKYEEEHDDISYAHPDGGHANPGYFTKK